MKTKSRITKFIIVIASALALVFNTPAALAVAHKISLTGADGQPLKKVKVTIEFPDGTQKEEESDDKGVVIFDFSGSGKVNIKRDGVIIKTVDIAAGGGGAGMSKNTALIGGGVAGALFLGLAAGNSGSSGSGESSMFPDYSGPATISFSPTSSESGSAFSCDCQVDVNNGQITIIGTGLYGSSSNTLNVSGTIDQNGIFTVAGHKQIAGVHYAASGSGTLGSDGSISGCSFTYDHLYPYSCAA